MGKLWLNDFQSITRVCHVETPNAPFACIFKEVSEAESANPESICGIHVDFGSEEQYVVCATDEETLVFDVTRECPDVEKERIGLQPKKVSESNSTLVPGATQVDEQYDRAWNVIPKEDVPKDTMDKIEKVLGKAL